MSDATVPGRAPGPVTPNCRAIRGRASPSGSRMISVAMLSYDVSPMLMITSGAPARTALMQREPAGSTVSVVPTARTRSQVVRARLARENTSGDTLWPNIVLAVFRIPPHCRHGGAGSPAPIRASTSVVGDRCPHPVQTTTCIVPCSSITRSAGMPAR